MGLASRIVSGSLSALLSLVAVLTLPTPPKTRPWKAARLLAVESTIPEEAVIEALIKAGISKVTHFANQEVQYADFSGIATTYLARLPTILEESDPRYDFYLKTLAGYFEGFGSAGEYRLYYLPDSLFHRSNLKRSLSLFLTPAASWILVEKNTVHGFFLPLIALLGLIGLSIYGLRPRQYLALQYVILPFALCFFSGNPDFSIIAFSICFSLIAFIRIFLLYPYEKKYNLKSFINISIVENRPMGLIVLLGAALSLTLILGFFSILLALFASLVALPLTIHADERNRILSKDRFFPLRLRLKTRVKKSANLHISEILALFLILIFIIDGFLSRPVSGKPLLSIPQADSYTPADGREERLPSLADFSEHARFQTEFSKTNLRQIETELPYIGYSFDESGIEGERPIYDIADGEKTFRPRGLELILSKEGHQNVFRVGPWPGRVVRSGIGPLAWSIATIEAIIAMAVILATLMRGAGGPVRSGKGIRSRMERSG